MEGLALPPASQQNTRGELREISPYTLLRPALQLDEPLQGCLQEFWNVLPGLKLFSIAKSPHYYWHMQDFYVAQKGLDKEGKRWAQLRISEGICQYLFETVLGKLPEEPDFTLANIRSFEVFLLERFSRKLFQILSQSLLKPPGKKAPPPEKDAMMHLVWVMGGGPEQINQLILTAPQSCLRTHFEESVSPVVWHLADDVFLQAHAQVVLRVGRTGARLEELQQLEPGDIVVFEDSHIGQWELMNPVTRGWQKVAVSVPEARRIPDLLTKQGTRAMANEMHVKPNIWDNLEVEITASFNPVKMPLKQIKEMEQGLVVEVGDLMDNRLQIEVEGHPVAWGELLVLGDKFGVRIQGLHDSVAGMAQTSPSGGQAPSVEESAVYSEDNAMANASNTGTSDEYMDLELDESDFDDLDDEEDWT